jgi:hypothetical protein
MLRKRFGVKQDTVKNGRQSKEKKCKKNLSIEKSIE